MSGVVDASVILGRSLTSQAEIDAAAAARAALSYDLGLMMVTDTHRTAADNEAALKDDLPQGHLLLALGTTRALVERLWKLPMQAHNDDERADEVDSDAEDVSQAVAKLPQPVLRLPREKPVPIAPEDKPMTRWEKFAQRKGIEKQKKTKLVWDETEHDWVPRYGRGSANKLARQREDWVVEAPDAGVSIVKGKSGQKALQARMDAADAKKGSALKKAAERDPFAEKEKERAKMLQKQRANQASNKKRARKAMTAGLGVLDADVKGQRVPANRAGKERKDRILQALKTAQVSTASMGRFDREVVVEGTKMPKRPQRKVMQSEVAPKLSSEKESHQRILKRILDGTK